MSILNKLERRFGNLGIPNLTVVLIVPQVALYVLSIGRPEILNGLYLIPALVLEGQWWRLITFLVIPPFTNPIFAFFFWYMFFLMGGALEGYWGSFRYNIYLLIGYLATLAVTFLTPGATASNGFLQGSVFLAFAFLYPDFQLLIFFIIPVKIKWIAGLTWIYYIYIVVFGNWPSRLLVLASVCNFLIFFYTDIVHRIKTGQRHMAGQATRFGASNKGDQPFHRCTVCGITDQTHPDMDFRYCQECSGTLGYCSDHLANHQHLQKT